MLAEARAELDEFQRSSKELEDELERELERTEKTQEELRQKAARAELERDEWKVRILVLILIIFCGMASGRSAYGRR